jgi:ParB-like chromosome segregation protein Spo0J
MKLIELELSDLVVSEELSRSGSAKQFEERLKSSIEEIGLAEPIKVAPLPTGRYVVVDGTMRLKAIAILRKTDPSAFMTIPAYVVDYDRRYELRYQTDIYQDLLPSQLAGLVENLHKTEHVRKADIARYIGVSPATLRNYTGLWRLLQRGGLFAQIVELMDVEVIPSSNPYAWLRLTATGLRYVLEHHFSEHEEGAESWVEQRVLDARQGKVVRFPIKFVEFTTDSLPAEYYREGEELRTVKRDLGLRRAAQSMPMTMPSDSGRLFDVTPEPTLEGAKVRNGSTGATDADSIGTEKNGIRSHTAPISTDVIRNLSSVSRRSPDPVLRSAARSLKAYLQ